MILVVMKAFGEKLYSHFVKPGLVSRVNIAFFNTT
jgi:hypothetical protein